MLDEVPAHYRLHADIRSNTSGLHQFPDSSVHEVVLEGTFEELGLLQKNESVSEWLRVLKPKGRLTIRLSKNGNEETDACPSLGRKADEGGGLNLPPVASTGPTSRFQKSEPTYGSAQELIRQGRGEEAIVVLEAVLKKNPNHSQSHDDLGALYFQSGKSREALDHFLLAVEADPQNLNARMNLADLLLQSGRPEEAFRHYNEVLGKMPDHAEALKGVAQSCEAAGLEEDAVFFYERSQQAALKA